jgi:hypothetical protein
VNPGETDVGITVEKTLFVVIANPTNLHEFPRILSYFLPAVEEDSRQFAKIGDANEQRLSTFVQPQTPAATQSPPPVATLNSPT